MAGLEVVARGHQSHIRGAGHRVNAGHRTVAPSGKGECGLAEDLLPERIAGTRFSNHREFRGKLRTVAYTAALVITYGFVQMAE